MEIGDKFVVNDRLEKWAFFFKNEGLLTEEEEMNILIKNDPVMDHAHKAYKKFTADEELLQVYEAREKRLRDEATRLEDAKEEGAYEKALESARILKESGVSLDIICKSTGLTEEKIVEL